MPSAVVLAVSVEQAHVPAVVGALPAWGAVEVAVVSAAAVVAAAAVAVVAGGDNQIMSTPGTQDGVSWRNSDGTWSGPSGEKVAAAVLRGYTTRTEPFHGYFFKVLEGQGRAAPLGEMNFVVKDVMIGGFALIAGEHFVAVNRFPKKKERTHD